MKDRGWPRAFGATRPSARLGLGISVCGVALTTAVIYPLKAIAPAVSLSVVYLPAVLVVSAYWGLRLGLFTSLLSAAAFNFFHIPPVGRFTIADGRNWVALGAFVLVAAVVSTMAELARSQNAETQRRTREADLAAGLARELLAGGDTSSALGITARRVSEALAIRSAAIELGSVAGTERREALALRSPRGEQIATLLVPRGLPSEVDERLRAYVLPSLEALVAIALRRDAVQAEAVETSALRRSDELKTALLRSVSHDLRSPITAVVTAGHALGAKSLTTEERTELSAAVVGEGERLAALVDKLLDLSRLQAGRAEPTRDWVSVEELLLAAREVLADDSEVRITIDRDVPMVQADAAQLQQVFKNVLENAWRYSDGHPVTAHARRAGSKVVVRVVDQGPGIQAGEQQRIFEPFYRGRQAGVKRWVGSGLGLAIAKGFVEANEGTIAVESLPGQGTSIVIELPLESEPALT